MDREGDASRELGLLRECEPTEATGDRERGVLGACGSRLVAEVAGERGRVAGWYGSDLLRTRDPSFGQHIESLS